MITGKQSLIDYTLRALGEPVMQINVTEEQLSDRLDDTLQKFKEFHYNGTQRMYISHKLTSQDIVNKYISVPDNVIGIIRVFSMVEGAASGMTTGDSGLFSVQYQIRLGDLWNISTGSMAYYESLMQNMSLLDQTFNGVPLFRYTQIVNKLYIDGFWGANLTEGMYVAFECFVTTDPDEYNKIWDQIWVKEYYKNLVQRQWGVNLKKFGNITLIGGVTINGQQLYDEAMQEIERLEDELVTTWQLPVEFYVG